jgi:hypothetical protein
MTRLLLLRLWKPTWQGKAVHGLLGTPLGRQELTDLAEFAIPSAKKEDMQWLIRPG